MPGPAHRIILIGLGAAGTTHLTVLEDIPSVAVVATVDKYRSQPVVFRGEKLPLYERVLEARELQDIDIAVVATPTPTHAAVCREVAEHFPDATILVEKPAAENLADAQELLADGAGKPLVHVALHMAFAPEVSWAASLVTARMPDLGAPVAIESWSADPYQSDLASAQSTLCTSWIDTGINALSVIDRFARVVSRTSLRRIGKPSWSMFEGIFGCEVAGGYCEASILTSWNVTDSTRSTRIRYSSGAEIVMDHNAVAGYLMEDGRTAETFGSDGSTPRRTSHYEALYRWWLTDGHPIHEPEAALRLHTLLLSSVAEL